MGALIADHPGDDEPADVVIGIETDRGPWVQALLAAGYRVHAVNPLSGWRRRSRSGPNGAGPGLACGLVHSFTSRGQGSKSPQLRPPVDDGFRFSGSAAVHSPLSSP